MVRGTGDRCFLTAYAHESASEATITDGMGQSVKIAGELALVISGLPILLARHGRVAQCFRFCAMPDPEAATLHMNYGRVSASLQPQCRPCYKASAFQQMASLRVLPRVA